MKRATRTGQVDIQPPNILAGLGAAERDLLATCLALFYDSTLISRFEKWYAKATDKLAELSGEEIEQAKQELRTALSRWRESDHSDDELRLILWIRLREALGLPPRLSATWRGCSYLADDMAATLIHVLDPPKLSKTGKRWLYQRGWLDEDEQAVTLADIVLPVLDELLENSPRADDFPSDPETRRRVLAEAVAALNRLTESEQEKLLEDTRAGKLHDSAAIKALMVGGGLVGFGAGVGAAGFSAYILAAQASAFVPFVSGVGLVSFVSVLSNPVTIAGVAVGTTWWLASSARKRAAVAVASRVVSMLAIRGLQAGRSGLDDVLASFPRVQDLESGTAVSEKLLNAYRKEWELVEPLWRSHAATPPESVRRLMEALLDSSREASLPRPAPDDPAAGDEHVNAMALATMTVGDVLYSAAAVDPTVIRAADFSRFEEIDGRLDFADLSREILNGSDSAVLGHISQLKGYVAEHAVAAELTAAGHTVSFPDTPNTPGWDLVIDGQPFQVKFHSDLNGIREHFEHYDYPVIANTELHGDIPETWQDQVFFVDGLSNELVTQITKQSQESVADILEPGHISMAGLVSATRGLIAYRSGQLTGRQALEQVLLDGTVRASLFGAGGIVGATVGTMMFGPAGAWVFGAGTPILAQMQTSRMTTLLKEHVKGKAHHEWESRAHQRVDALQQAVRKALIRKRHQIAQKMAATPDNQAGEYLCWRLADEGRFTRECQDRIERLDDTAYPLPEQRATELFRWLAACAIHPAIYQPELRAVTQVLGDRPGLSELIDKEKVGAKWDQVKGVAAEWAQFVNQKVADGDVLESTKYQFKKVFEADRSESDK